MDVIVVGGGVMGAAAAWQLAARGADVTLLEQFAPGHERGASHGSSRIFRLAYTDDAYVGLAQQSLMLWRQLEHDTSVGVLTLTGAVDHGDPTAIEALHAALRRAGAPASVMTPDEAAGQWPGLRFDTAVLVHRDAGRLHADRAVEALKIAAVRAGADIRHHAPVTSVAASGRGQAAIVTDEGQELVAGSVVVAAGAWTAKLLRDVSLPPMRVTLEQPAHFTPHDAGTPWPSFIHHPGAGFSGPLGSAAYGLGSEDGVKVGFHAVGPDFDPDESTRNVDADRLAALQDYARAWVPGVDPDHPEPITCTYTLTPDQHFVIDRAGPITVLAGFSGHGFKFAPAVGVMAADLVLEGRSADALFALGDRTAPDERQVIR